MSWMRPGLALAVGLACGAAWNATSAAERDADPATNGEAMRLQYLRPASPDGTRQQAWVDAGSLYVAQGASVSFRVVREDGEPFEAGHEPVWGGTSGATGVGASTSVVFCHESTSMGDTTSVTATVDGKTVGSSDVVSHGDDVAAMSQVLLDTDEPQVKRVGLRLSGKMWGVDLDNDLVMDDMYGHVTLQYRDVYQPDDESMHDGPEICFDSGEAIDTTAVTQECLYHFEISSDGGTGGDSAAAVSPAPVAGKAVTAKLDVKSYVAMAVKWFAPKLSGAADEVIKEVTKKVVAWIEGGAKVVDAESTSQGQTGGRAYGDVEVKFTVKYLGKTTIGKGYLGLWYSTTTGQVTATTDHLKVNIDGGERTAETSAFASAVGMAKGVGDNNGPHTKRSEAQAGASGNMPPDWSREAPYVYYYCSCFYYNADLYRFGKAMNGKEVVYEKSNTSLQPDELWHKGFLFYRVPTEFQH